MIYDANSNILSKNEEPKQKNAKEKSVLGAHRINHK